MSAREWRAAREGDAHAAPKTSSNNTPESFIVGVGASGRPARRRGDRVRHAGRPGLVQRLAHGRGRLRRARQRRARAPRHPRSAPAARSSPVSAAAGQLRGGHRPAAPVAPPAPVAAVAATATAATAATRAATASRSPPRRRTPPNAIPLPPPPAHGRLHRSGRWLDRLRRPGHRDQGSFASRDADPSLGSSPGHFRRCRRAAIPATSVTARTSGLSASPPSSRRLRNCRPARNRLSATAAQPGTVVGSGRILRLLRRVVRFLGDDESSPSGGNQGCSYSHPDD